MGISEIFYARNEIPRLRITPEIFKNAFFDMQQLAMNPFGRFHDKPTCGFANTPNTINPILFTIRHQMCRLVEVSETADIPIPNDRHMTKEHHRQSTNALTSGIRIIYE